MQVYYNTEEIKQFKANIDAQKNRIRSEAFDENNSNYGVDGSTMRAFHKTKFGDNPTKVYRAWAKEKTFFIFSKQTKIIITDQNIFDKWHEELFESLCKFWLDTNNCKLEIAYANKLVDLYVKWLSLNKECSAELANSLIQYGYCALDKHTLKKLNKCLSDVLPMPETPSMGIICNSNRYTYCQQLIENFAYHCEGTKLLFDYYAWANKAA